jgi:hypothetical protein
VPISEIWIWAARLGAMVLAALSGWLLGRTPPDWRGDDETARTSGGVMSSYYYRPFVVYGRGCSAGSWGPGLAAAGALILLNLGWPETMEDMGMGHDGSTIALLLAGPFWLALAVWLIGWTISRLTDKGPVGPLE